MSGYDVSYEDHAAIYSAGLWLLFHAIREFAPFLVVQLSQVAYRRLVVLCWTNLLAAARLRFEGESISWCNLPVASAQ